MKTATRAFLVLAVGVLVLVAAGVATTAPSKERETTFGAAVHGDLTLVKRDGSTVKISFDRGTVTGKTGGSVTLERKDRKTVTSDVAPDALVVERGVRSSLADVAVGDHAAVFYRDGSAFLIRYHTPGQAPAASARPRAFHRPGLLRLGLMRAVVHGDFVVVKPDGTTAQIAYDRGEITATSASSITLKRRDGQSVTLAVDSQTVVRKKGQQGALAALAVGDRAMVFSTSGRALLIRAIRMPAP